MIKRELLVSCDRNLIHIENCIKCVFYLGMTDNQIDCGKDSSVMQDLTQDKLKNIMNSHIMQNIEFGIGEKVDVKV